jgi:hypothetical protein
VSSARSDGEPERVRTYERGRGGLPRPLYFPILCRRPEPTDVFADG